MSILQFVNMCFFQLLFIRLTRHMKKDIYGKYTITERWSFMYWVVPFTGWGNNYKYIGTHSKYLFISK